MNQRLVAACVALPLVFGLLIYAGLARLPYATYKPGGTLDVLGEDDNEAEIVQVLGHKTFRDDDGELRMTTVAVSPPQPKDARGLSLVELLGTWLDSDDAVYPYLAVHPDDETEESSRREGAAQMASSQDFAVRVALVELGYDVPQVLKVASITEDAPADGVLQVDDRLLAVNGTSVSADPEVSDDEELRTLIGAAPQGQPLRIKIQRGEKTRTVSLTPKQEDGRQIIGILPGFDYDFPVEVSINISPDIGGPSAGLMFSLAVYDTLTPGSLPGDHVVAGTGEITPDGEVGPIGGIQQKIAGARQSGADLFLVPRDNCQDALGADNGDMRLVMATTMHEARLAVAEHAKDPDADLPSCEDADTEIAEDGQ
jgi:PDZ domain-containing protein